MRFPESGIVALLGANGAGKSTILKAISGLLKHEDGEVTDGTIEFMGERIDKIGAEKIAKRGIVQVIEGRRVFEHLTVEQNLKVGAHMKKYGRSIKDGLEMVYHYFPRLKEKRNETAGFISGGEQQMTVVGRALMTSPKLILLDEPSMGLAPLLIHEIFNIIMRLNREEKDLNSFGGTECQAGPQCCPTCLRVWKTGASLWTTVLINSGKIRISRISTWGMTDFGGRKSFRDVKHYKRRKTMAHLTLK